MDLGRVRVESAAPGRVRMTAEVRFDDPAAGTEEFWFEVPETCAADLSTTGNPWLACLAPLAAQRGEPLRIGLPVDALMARNIRELLAIWSAWYSRLKVVPLELDVRDDAVPTAPSRTGAFFSGGVDSFYTVLRHGADHLRPDELILIRGFDFPLEFREEFDRHRDRMRAAAESLGMELVDVATNLRETRLREAPWATLWHGSALASSGLALERRYRYLLVASSSTYGELEPYGSHPMTDVLHSTSTTRILHDGADATRLDKVGYVAGSDLALRYLHVCFRETSGRNCGRCRKCLLAMLGLLLSGAGDRCTAFDGGPDLDRVRRILFTTEGQRHGVRRLRTLARRQGRTDVVRALDEALRRSARRGVALRWFQKAGRIPSLRPAAQRARRAVLAGVVR
jgi:hypothetical protein